MSESNVTPEQAAAAPQYKAEDFFIVLLPSRTRQFFINTALILAEVHHDLDKLLLMIPSGAPGGFAAVRQGCVDKLKETLDEKGIAHGPVVRALWLDDDILIDEPISRVSAAIKKADEIHANIVANYRIPWHNDTIVNSIGLPGPDGVPHFATSEELAALKNWQQLPPRSHAGLGFYYGDVPLDYKYHYDYASKEDQLKAKSWFDLPKAEDVNFYYDNKITLTYVDLTLKHDKHVLL
jgi:hypothetical protein